MLYSCLPRGMQLFLWTCAFFYSGDNVRFDSAHKRTW